MSKENAFSWIDKHQKHIIELSDKIWDLAEVGLQEFKSSALLADELQKGGFSVQRGVAGMPSAFVAIYGSEKPVIGIMGEYDALAGLSQKPIPKREPIVPGAPGHGCGHNIHGTSGVAAALAVKAVMETQKLKGTLKFFGCPAEETLVGKVFMVRDGVFKGLDAVLSHHPGQMSTAPLSSYTAMNSMKFHFRGKASHAGGSPEQGRSALDAVELMDAGVNFLREHVVQEARIHYIIEDGGGQPNVVPAYARSWYFVRAPERQQVEHIYDRVLKIAEGADLMAETSHEVEFLTGCYNTLRNMTLAELVVDNMREIGTPTYSGEELAFAHTISQTILPEEKRNLLQKSKRPGWEKLLDVEMDTSIAVPWGMGDVQGGSTDVGDVSWNAPAMEFSTATYPLGTSGHSWQNVASSRVGIGHKSLIFAAKIIAGTALDLMTEPDVLSRARKEFEELTKDTKYVSPLPKTLKPPLNQLPSTFSKGR
jgi:aminobenzoyl-glutamate utilization protein B